MRFEKLGLKNVDQYISYLRAAMSEEPEMMTAESVDAAGVIRRLKDRFYQNTASILAIQDGAVVGRIEFHFYGCIQDGFRMAYVDWVYVRKAYRHQGIAQGLFREFEKECRGLQIDQYYLITAKNHEAERFYQAFSDAERKMTPVLRKNLEYNK